MEQFKMGRKRSIGGTITALVIVAIIGGLLHLDTVNMNEKLAEEQAYRDEVMITRIGQIISSATISDERTSELIDSIDNLIDAAELWLQARSEAVKQEKTTQDWLAVK